MLLIDCPHCGPRAQTEFSYGGDATVQRPDPETATTAEWLDHVYLRANRCGPNLEWWHHVAGCRRWIKVVRDTQTHELLASAAAGERLELPT